MDKFKLAYNRDLGNWTKQHLLPDMQQTSLKIFFDPGTYAFVYASRRPTPSDNVLPHTAPVESTFEEAPTLPSRKVFQNFFGVWGLGPRQPLPRRCTPGQLRAETTHLKQQTKNSARLSALCRNP